MMRQVSRRLVLSTALRAAALGGGALAQACASLGAKPDTDPPAAADRPVFFISDPCIGTKDTACVNVCPVDAIHPRNDEVGFVAARMLFIHPDDCIDCGACVPACPVCAIYEDAPAPSQVDLREANALAQDPANASRVDALVHGHIARYPDLMAIDPARRRRAHQRPEVSSP